MPLAIEYLSRPAAGQQENGDAAFFRSEGSRTLFVVFDALGHGPNAAAASQVALDYLQTAPLHQKLAFIVEGLHRSTRGTRGGAACICLFERGLLTCCAIGNVEMRTSASVSLLPTSGVVGLRLNSLRVAKAELSAGDRLYLFSDGISNRFCIEEVDQLATTNACEMLLANHSIAEDDATILVAEVREQDAIGS